MLITLCLKNPSHFSELLAQPGRDALGFQPTGHRCSKICPEEVDHMICLVTLSNGLVKLLADHAALRAEPFYSLE